MFVCRLSLTSGMITLPGINQNLTGFWGTEEGVKNLAFAHYMEGLSRDISIEGVVFITTKDNCIISEELLKSNKSNHYDRFDKDEIFVTGFLDNRKIISIDVNHFISAQIPIDKIYEKVFKGEFLGKILSD